MYSHLNIQNTRQVLQQGKAGLRLTLRYDVQRHSHDYADKSSIAARYCYLKGPSKRLGSSACAASQAVCLVTDEKRPNAETHPTMTAEVHMYVCIGPIRGLDG